MSMSSPEIRVSLPSQPRNSFQISLVDAPVLGISIFSSSSQLLAYVDAARTDGVRSCISASLSRTCVATTSPVRPLASSAGGTRKLWTISASARDA